MPNRCLPFLCLVLWFLASAGLARAGEAELPADADHHQALSMSLGEFVSWLPTPAGSGDPALLMTAEQSNRFSRSRHPVLRFGHGTDEIWLQVDLRNPDPTPYRLIVSLDRHNIEKTDFYLADDPATPIPKKLCPLTATVPAVEITIPATTTKRLLVRVESSTLRNFSLLAQDRQTFTKRQQANIATAGLQIGILLLASALALAVFLRVRQKTELVAGLLFLNLALFVALYQGLPLLTHWVNSMLYGPASFSSAPLYPAGILAFLSYMALECLFSRYLLDLADKQPTLDRLMMLAAMSCIGLLATLPFIEWSEFNRLVLMFPFAILPLQTIAAIQCWRSGQPQTTLYLISRLFVMAVCLMFALSTMTHLPLQKTWFQESLWLMIIGTGLLLPGLLERLIHRFDQDAARQRHIAVAEAETRARNEFLTRLSHEIRTPMNGILGMTELLEETTLSPTQADYVRTIHSSGNNLLHIIDDILDYSKIETGKMTLDITAFDLASMLHECMEIFKLRAEEKSLELIGHIETDVPAQVKGDPARIRQAVANLVANAIRFTEKGEVMLHVSRDNDASPRHIRFEVRDTATHLDKEKLQQLLSGNLDEENQSAGLSLAISQQLVKMMGGQLGASHRSGQGNVFWFSIPLEAVADEGHAPFFIEQLQGLRMLVVDDNASCRLVIQQQASSWGMQVTTAVNGKQAIALLRTQANLDEPYDVVILDQDMPGMNGLELAARIKEDPLVNNNLLVMMLTGHSIAPTATTARNAGVRRVITKPVTGRMLKIALAEELGHLRKINAEAITPDEKTMVELSHLSVLVAEDHPLSQKVINGMMHRLGVNSHLVADGAAAVEEARKGVYDLILMDCDMPVMDGFEATQRIRTWEQQNRRKPLPIIALTAHIMDEHKERSLACGMNAHLSKPVELAELRDTMLRWVNASRQT